VQLLISSACVITINLKSVLRMQCTHFDILDAVMPLFSTQSFMIFTKYLTVSHFSNQTVNDLSAINDEISSIK
jgi:hypothetical protein